jgi:hypothetical protein
MPYAEEDEAALWGIEEGIIASWNRQSVPDLEKEKKWLAERFCWFDEEFVKHTAATSPELQDTYTSRPVWGADFAGITCLWCDGRSHDERLAEKLAFFNLPLLIDPGEARLKADGHATRKSRPSDALTSQWWLGDCEMFMQADLPNFYDLFPFIRWID